MLLNLAFHVHLSISLITAGGIQNFHVLVVSNAAYAELMVVQDHGNVADG